jgi:hypothetical protein
MKRTVSPLFGIKMNDDDDPIHQLRNPWMETVLVLAIAFLSSLVRFKSKQHNRKHSIMHQPNEIHNDKDRIVRHSYIVNSTENSSPEAKEATTTTPTTSTGQTYQRQQER